ncbi:fucolectin-1-like [Polymixia lowei]
MMTTCMTFFLLVAIGEIRSISNQRPPIFQVKNIARGGKVVQSSPYGNAAPERAIDGNRASIWTQGSCTHTQNDFKPWWRVDLLKTYKVNFVTITNRKDCCHKRINGAEIRIGNSLHDNGNSNPRCAVISYMPAGASRTFKCNGMEGRYVNVVIPGRREYLTLCEVEVYGDIVSSASSFIRTSSRGI